MTPPGISRVMPSTPKRICRMSTALPSAVSGNTFTQSFDRIRTSTASPRVSASSWKKGCSNSVRTAMRRPIAASCKLEPGRTSLRAMADPRSIAKALGPWIALLLAVVLFVVSRSVCISAWLTDGIVTQTCPDGDVRPTLAVDGSLRRGTDGVLQVHAVGHFTTGPADQDLTAPIRRFRPVAILRTHGGAETALDLDWRATVPGTKEAKVRLPADLADGDHVLVVRAVTAAGTTSTEVPLAVFAPAKVHVLTDR